MKKISVICLLLAFLFVFSVSGQAVATTPHSDGDFTMNIPRGWTPMSFGLKYMNVVGPEDDGFTPNFAFGDDVYTGSIKDYIDLTVTQLDAFYSNIQILQRGEFSTSSGLQGEFITFSGDIMNTTVWLKMYALRNRNRTALMTIACASGIKQSAKYEPIFDTCVRSFNWTR